MAAETDLAPDAAAGEDAVSSPRARHGRTVRIFVSSPFDAQFERMRIERVVERLNGEFAGIAQLVTVRWELEFYKAHKTFQAQIPEAADCDIVVAVLRHRLGMELPDDFAPMPSGEPYPSGTAYEILTAMESAGRKGTPDLYVFRYPEPPTIKLDDAGNNALITSQWEKLKAFFARWFLTSKGHFKASYHEFRSTDEFEAQVESLLRKWLEEKVLLGRAVVWPVETRGSPFRGLAAFSARHAPVFFGRSREIARSVELLKDAAGRGAPFLLVVGASGAGKSSLAMAGVLPRLTTPGVVGEVDRWRFVQLTLGERPGDPVAALATRLFEASSGEDHGGRLSALPELRDGDYPDPEALVRLFGHADETSIRPLVAALDKAAATVARSEGHDRRLRADLVVLVDQLDNLFSASMTDEERSHFARLLSAMVATGRIWVIATLRANLYERFLREPALFDLKARGATYDLSPPGPAELAEIVRKPAEAADFLFERDPRTGRGLDEQLLLDADRPDMLPLLQFTLDQLFEARETVDGKQQLTFAAYEALGGISGAIDRQAERALVAVGPEEQEKLPRLLRQLAETAHDRRDSGPHLTIRAVTLAEAAYDPASTQLVEALVDARILLMSSAGPETIVRLAHQRVLESWRRGRDIVIANAEFYRIRAEIDEQRQRWLASGQRRELLLPRGVPLAEAESITTGFPSEVSPEAQAFVGASGRHARTRQRIVGSAAILFALIAAVAIWQTFAATSRQAEAASERDRAEANFDAAKGAVEALTFDVVQGLRNIAGMQVESRGAILETIQTALDGLAAAAPDDPDLLRVRAAMLSELALTYAARGDVTAARAAANESTAITRQMLAQSPDDPDLKRNVGVAVHRLGSLLFAIGDIAGAVQPAEESLTITEALAAANPDDPALQADWLSSLDLLGAIQLPSGDFQLALETFEASLAIARSLVAADPANGEWRRYLTVALNKVGDAYVVLGDPDAAEAAYSEGLEVARALSARDPGNVLWLRDVAVQLGDLGDLAHQRGQFDEALAAYEETLAISAQLATLDPGNTDAQRDRGFALGRIGVAREAMGDVAGAIEAYREALGISRALADADPANLGRQRDLSASLDQIGDALVAAGDIDGAVEAYQEGLTIARNLIGTGPGTPQQMSDLVISLAKVATVTEGDVHDAAIEEGLAILEGMRAAGTLAAGQQGWTQILLDLR